MPTPGPPPGADVDVARRLVVERGLTRAAFEHLTADAMMNLPFDALGPTKTLLKRFFSTDSWGTDDDAALAAAVGPGEGTWRRHLDGDVVLEYGWADGRFGLRVSAPAAALADKAPASGVADEASGVADGAARVVDEPAGVSDEAAEAPAAGAVDEAAGAVAGVVGDPLAGTFDGPVVPEATPNPRSIRFQVGPIPQGGGPDHGRSRRWYESAAAAADDPGPARLFAEFEEVANVLVGPDFVAVGLHRAPDWERLLRPVLDVVTDEFADPDAPPDESGPRVMGGPAGAGVVGGSAPPAGLRGAAEAGAGDGARRLSRLERAWRDLGSLHPGTGPDDLTRVRAAAAGDDPSHRQVAANLLGEADPEVAATDWARLVVDPVRSVRRAAVDAIVDAGRPGLRSLLETALTDADAWVRWKAVRGLADLGADPSRDAITALSDDADFRIRLEVAAALRRT